MSKKSFPTLYSEYTKKIEQDFLDPQYSACPLRTYLYSPLERSHCKTLPCNLTPIHKSSSINCSSQIITMRVVLYHQIRSTIMD